jgi:hypothetical protein
MGGVKMSGIGRVARAAIILAHALAGWAYCGALIGIGRHLFPMQTTLVIHAIGAPVGFALISLFYFRKFGFTSPIRTALLFLSIVVALDLLLVAPIFEKSFAMFASVLGTWIPFALIFIATLVTGLLTGRSTSSRSSSFRRSTV